MTKEEKNIYRQNSNKPCTDHIEDSDTRIYAVYVIALSLIMLLISNLL